jgi:hypothetical protein
MKAEAGTRKSQRRIEGGIDMVSRSRRLLMLLVLAIVLDFLGGISLFGIYHGYDVWGELAMSGGWLLVSGVLVFGAALLLIGLRRWQAYFAGAALASVAASVLYWWVWFTQEEPCALTGFLAGAAWAGAAVAAGLSWSRLLLFRTQRSTARVG